MRRQTVGPGVGTSTSRVRLSEITMTPAHSYRASALTPRASRSAKPSHRLSVSVAPPMTPRSASQGKSRRSSVIGRIPRVIQDPRNLSDKSFQQQAIKDLLLFVSSYKFPQEVSPKVLSSPPSHLVVNLLEFMLRLLDPHFEFGDWQAEVPMVFEFLGYPFKIRKQTLVNMGSPHAWPSILAALLWLAELIEYRDGIMEIEAEKEFNPEFDDSGDSEKWFYKYLKNAYSSFMDGVDTSEIENGLAEICKSRSQGIESDVVATEKMLSQLQSEVAMMTQHKADVAHMESDKDNAAIDLAKFENIIEQMEIEISKYERMIQEKEKQIQETALELERNSLRQKEVQKEISKQAITAEDVARLGKEERRLADLLQRLADQDDQVKTMLWQCDQESSHALESIEEHVSHFNSLACEMQMVPSSAKFAFGIDLELSVVDSDSCVLNKDIKFLSTKLREIHGKINEMVLGTNEENHAIEQSLKTVEQDIQLGTDGLESLMQSRQQAEQAFVEEQTALNKQVNDGLARVEAMELDLVKNSNKFSDQVQDLEETAQQLKKDLQSFSSMNLDQEKDLMNQISITAENMFERRMSIAGHVKALHATVKSVYDKVVGDGDSEKVLKFLKVDDDAIPQTTITVNIADLGANEETRVLLR